MIVCRKHAAHFYFMINGWTFEDLKNFWTEFGLNNLVGDDFISQWLLPGAQQEREWAQQMLSTIYQNEWNSEGAKLDRMKAAGINPYLSAQGIAGSGGSSSSVAGAPPTAVGSGAKAMDTLGNVANAAFGGVSAVANAKETLGLLDLRKQQIHSETILNLENAGLSHWNALSVATLLPSMNDNARADFYLKLATIDKTNSEYQNNLAQHRNIMKQYDEIVANVNLIYSQEQVEQARKLQIEEDTRWQKAENEFWETHGYLRNSPSDVALMNSIVDGKLLQAENIGSAIEFGANALKFGEYTADASTAYARAHHAAAGAYNADPIQQQFREAYDEIDKLSDLQNDVGIMLNSLDQAYKDGKISEDEYNSKVDELKKLQKDMNSSMHELQKVFNRLSYQNNHANMAQKILEDLTKIGVGVAGLSITKQKPVTVKGFTGHY